MMTAGTLIRQFNVSGKKAVSVSMADVQTMKQPAFIIMVSGVLLTSFGYFTPLNLLPCMFFFALICTSIIFFSDVKPKLCKITNFPSTVNVVS
jgi:hypothetical protein